MECARARRGARPASDLVATCLRGDRGAWETLVRTHDALVYAVVRKCGFDGDEADELFHEVWLAAWEQLGTAPDERGVPSWLAILAARGAKRALQRRVQLAGAPPAVLGPSPG